jgi:beta-1,2-xylosyltransferase
MGLNLPFTSPLSLPLPRRFLILGVTLIALVLFLNMFAPTALPPALAPNRPHHEPDASYFSPSKWLPPILNPDTPDRPLEFDEEGSCLFLSPFDALSSAEKARARLLELEEVSSGVVRTKPTVGRDDDPDFDDEMLGNGANSSFGGHESGVSMSGMTHPILALLRDGEKKWKDRMARQSKTLEEAVAVYKDRWGRNPPKGFDAWSVLDCPPVVSVS